MKVYFTQYKIILINLLNLLKLNKISTIIYKKYFPH